MRVICVDDERILMEDTAAMCRELPEVSDVIGFTRAQDALDWFKDNHAELALLDIDMPNMNGIELALRIKELSPDTAIIFLTGYSRYAIDAFAVRAAGYLLKPVSKEVLAKDIAYVSSLRDRSLGSKKQVTVKTFGAFDVFVDDQPVRFRMAKCKEILAYLVDRQGGTVTRPQIASILWEDRPYDRKLQKQLDVYVRSMRDTLKEYGITCIFEMSRGRLRVNPEEFECDVYRFFAGDPEAVNAYRGEYMSDYSWASITEGALFWRKSPNRTTE